MSKEHHAFLGTIPHGWEAKKLKELVEFKNGKAHEQCVDENGEYILVTSKFVSTEGDEYRRTNQALSMLNKNDIAFVMSDVPNGKALAKCFLVDVDNKYTLNQRICSLTTLSMNHQFLFYFLNRNKYYLKFDNGVGQTNLRKDEVLDCPVFVPPLKEQQKIVEILSSVDAAIKKTEQVIAKTEEIKKGLMQQLLTKGIGHTEFKQTEIGEIPVEWQICSLEEISIIKGEYGIGASATEYNPSKPRYLRITDIDDYGYLSDKDIRGFDEEEYEKYLLKLGDLVFARTGNTTGKTYMYRSGDGDLVYAGFLIRFRFDTELCNVAFINYLTQTKYYSDWVNVNSQRSGQPGINSNQYCKFKVALPSISEQMKIVSILDKVEEKIKIERNKLEKYAYLKQGLMQQLLTGQVRVKVD